MEIFADDAIRIECFGTLLHFTSEQMAKKKNKNTEHQNDKIRAAQCRNEFFRKLKYIIDSTCGKHIFPLIPRHILEDTYVNRCSSFKVVADPGSNVSELILNFIKITLNKCSKTHIVPLHGYNIEISIYDYYTICLSIIMLHVRCGCADFPQVTLVRETLDKYVKDVDKAKHVIERMNILLCTYNWHGSDLRKSLYWYKHKFVSPESIPNLTENRIIAYSVVPEMIHVEIDGKARPAYRLGWAFVEYGPKWLSLKPSQLGIKNAFAEIPLDVYIQSHALNRLSERVDCFYDGLTQFNLYNSLKNPAITYDANNKLLIEFSFFDNKAGYFRADIVNGIILIRTFLFITNSGTPEGLKLEKNTGLKLLDKKYLEIDKLSTFMNSDLGTNEAARKVLTSSGCQSIIDLHEKMKKIAFRKDNSIHFDSMLAYMDINKSSISAKETECILESV